MPARKTEQFEKRHLVNSKIGRALSHPARLTIIEILKSETVTKNTDLIKVLGLSQTSVSNHIQKLVEADLIDLSFTPNSSFYISLRLNAENRVAEFVSELFGFAA